jgi:hypothetical protein
MKNVFEYVPSEKIIKIYLFNSDKITVIDEPTLYLVENIRWGLACDYATGWKNGKLIRMHWALTNDKWIDHKDRDKLNNRMNNLRPATHQQNHYNQPLQKKSRTGYKGVQLKPSGKYRARIMHNDRDIHLGYYDTPAEAAYAYNKKALELFGEFANLNKIED